MVNYTVEKTLRKDGSQSVILVDKEYKIIEEVALFLNHLEVTGRTLNTIEGYCRDLQSYYNWLESEGLKFSEVNKRIMISWINYINYGKGNEKKKSASTINRHLAAVTSFYNYFENIGGYIVENPLATDTENIQFHYQVQKINKKKINSRLYKQKEKKNNKIQRLFRNEIEHLYDELSKLATNDDANRRNQLIFKVLYETGCRIGEVLGLRIMDYSTPNPADKIGTIIIKRYHPLYHKDHSIKTNEREIPVSMELIYEIDEYVMNVRPFKEEIETIFVNHSPSTLGNFMTRSGIEKVFQKLSKITGIRCTPHMLRHTHGTELKEGGYNQIYISDRLGHSSIESTNKYMHISFDAQARAYEDFIMQRNKDVDQ